MSSPPSSTRYRFKLPKWNRSLGMGKLGLTAGISQNPWNKKTEYSFQLRLDQPPGPQKTEKQVNDEIDDITRCLDDLIRGPILQWMTNKETEITSEEGILLTEEERIQFEASFVLFSGHVMSNHPEYTYHFFGFSPDLAPGGFKARNAAREISQRSISWEKYIDFTAQHLMKNNTLIKVEITMPSGDNPFPTFKAGLWTCQASAERENRNLSNDNASDESDPIIAALTRLADEVEKIQRHTDERTLQDFLTVFNNDFGRCNHEAILSTTRSGNKVEYDAEVEERNYLLLLKLNSAGITSRTTSVRMMTDPSTDSGNIASGETLAEQEAGKEASEKRWKGINEGMKNSGYKVPRTFITGIRF